MSEQDLQRQCLDFLRAKYGSRADIIKVPVAAMKVAGGRSAKNPLTGRPDIHLCIGGRCHWIEIKLPGGKLRPIQAITHDAIREAGGIVHVVHSLEECMAAFEGIR